MTEPATIPVLSEEGPPPGAPASLSGHIAENIESIAAFQVREQQKLGDSHRRVGSVGDLLGRPAYLLALLLSIVLWIAANWLAPHSGWWPLDPPPFVWLQGFLTLAGVLTTTVILIAQNRYARLDTQRGHLALQLNMLAEQKITKLIHLLEELRRDLPMVVDRHDSVALAMQQPTDPAQVLSALQKVADGAVLATPTAQETGSQGRACDSSPHEAAHAGPTT